MNPLTRANQDLNLTEEIHYPPRCSFPDIPSLVDRQLLSLDLSIGDVTSFHCEDAIEREIIHLTKVSDGYEGLNALLKLVTKGYKVAVVLPSIKDSTDKYLYWLVLDIWKYHSLGHIFTERMSY